MLNNERVQNESAPPTESQMPSSRTSAVQPRSAIEFEAAPSAEPNLGRLADLRMDYRKGGLYEQDLLADPIAQFDLWMNDARNVHIPGTDEPHAMSLATADTNGIPSVRTVLLKGVDANGFTWFTNYESRKSREIAGNPNAALNFRWGGLERQVTVLGSVSRVDSAESDAYFYSRPVGSRIGAIVSAQSTVIADRDSLEAAASKLSEIPETELHRPAHWGGFRLSPVSIEFWQGRTSRLHDRIRFRRQHTSSPWIVERLAP
jgi:pyridoxamine 5'-phosphate oxidase